MNAYWIAPSGLEKDKNVYFQARRLFNVERLAESLTFMISAESYYLLSINGQEIGRGPARGTHSSNYYDSYEIAKYLHIGENEISVLCQCMNYDTFIAAPVEPALIAELEGCFGTDGEWDVRLCNEWRKDVNTYSVQVGFMEWRDFRKAPEKWTKASIISRQSPLYSKSLLPRDVPMLKETVYYPADIPVQASTPEFKNLEEKDIHTVFTDEHHDPLALDLKGLLLPLGASFELEPLPDNKGIALVFDFSREIMGRFELDITAPEGTVIDIGHDEELWKGRIKTNHSQSSYTFTDRYILDGKRLKIGNSIHDRGFRMVQIVIRNLKTKAIIHGVSATDRRYPLVEAAQFNSSDMLLNQIWKAGVETLSACMSDVYTDCPWRERSFWVNDLIVENRTGLQAFGDKRINARAFRMAASDVFPDGLIPGVCPCPRDKENLILLAPNLYISEMLADYYLYTADAGLVKEMIPVLEKALKKFSEWEDGDGLLCPPSKYWNFIDWSYELNHYGFRGKETSILNYFYLMALKNIIKLSKETEYKLKNDWIENRIKTLPEKIFSRFYRKETDLIADSTDLSATGGRFSQLAHALALLSDACPPEFRGKAERAISNHDLLIPEFYFHFFLFHALELTGQAEDGLKRIRKYWGEMIKTGTPTFWEGGIHAKGKAAYSEDGSLCHGFATSPLDFMQTVILGIKPLEAGFKSFSVKPQLFDLDFAEGRVPTPFGNIKIRIEKDGNKLKAELSVPAGIKADTEAGIFENGTHKFEI